MEKQSTKRTKIAYKLLVIGFWILIWQLASMKINEEIFLASPFSVLLALFDLIQTEQFMKSVIFSFSKIVFGFTLAMTVGILFAVFAHLSGIFRALIGPLIKIIKITPIASFIILALLWIHSRNLSILISFLMVLPIIYTNVLQGIESTDRKLLEMAKVFQVNPVRQFRFIYLPAIMPYFVTACSVGLGFCWKSGIAAEIIGLPNNSIGEQLYQAKLYLMTKEVLAWTIIIILLSLLFEKLVMILVNLLQKTLGGYVYGYQNRKFK